MAVPYPHLGCIGRLYSAWPESPTVKMTFAKIGKCDLFFLVQVVSQKQKYKSYPSQWQYTG